MDYIETYIPGVFIIEPKVFNDSRGYFFESYKSEEFERFIGKINFIQENQSCSSLGVLRGLHYQLAPCSQAKLVHVIQGSVLDVAVDIRKGSPTFGKHIAVELSEGNNRQLFIPRGFAHGFRVLSNRTIFTYKVDNPYNPEYERGIRFDDKIFNIDWRITDEDSLILSDKDRLAPSFGEAEYNFTF
jgi:dTDP-4-dehydrorhamnose 3,5-epimerase